MKTELDQINLDYINKHAMLTDNLNEIVIDIEMKKNFKRRKSYDVY